MKLPVPHNPLGAITLTVAMAVVLLAAMVGCAGPRPMDAPENDPMVGQLLVASPTMEESLFHHTVILILQHNEHGAFGIIVNRPIGEVSLVKLEQLIGEKDKKAEGSVLLLTVARSIAPLSLWFTAPTIGSPKPSV